MASLHGFATDIGLTFDWLATKPAGDPMLLAGPMVSVRVGYRRTTTSAEWHGDTNILTTASPIRYAPHSFYVTLGIGGGSFRRQ